jgi:hypothetical protein
MTWPLARNLSRAVSDPGDPYLNAFILDWDYTSLRGGGPLFDAPIFHPATNTLALSENLIGIALVIAPLRLAGASPLTAYNVALITGFAFSGFAMFLLALHVTRSIGGGFIAGTAFAFVPWRFVQLPHVQHVWSGWLPLTLLCVLLLLESPTTRRALLLAIATIWMGLSNIHWLILGGSAIGVSAIAIGLTTRARVRYYALLCAAFVVALLALLPILLPYAKSAKEHGTVRAYDETLAYSAEPRDWLSIAPWLRWYSRPQPTTDAELWLFPGVLPVVLACASLVMIRRTNKRAGTLGFAVCVLLGFAGSLGLHFAFHRMLFDWIYPFRAIRVPARWANIVYMGLAGLAGSAILIVPQRMRSSFAAAAVACLLCELRVAPVRWYMTDGDRLPVYEWLRALPKGTASLELPFADGGSDYAYELAATTHHQPIANGASGFSTPLYDRLALLAHADTIPPALLDELRAAHIPLLIVHADALGAHSATAKFLRDASASGRLLPLRHFDNLLQGDFVFLVAADATPLARERAMTDMPYFEQFWTTAKPSWSEHIVGVVESPAPRASVRGKLRVNGWALSPYGIDEVLVSIDNGGRTQRAVLGARREFTNAFPWFTAQLEHAGFTAEFDAPSPMWRDTDVQVEIVDRVGRRRRLPDRWITWQRE